jgi:hypothetical protein
MAKPIPKRLQDEFDEFYRMMGQCIAEWAKVDDELFRIFHACLGPLRQSAIIYYRTPGLDLRFGLTEELVLSILPKRQSGSHKHDDVKAWKGATTGHDSLLSVRRRIAHQAVTPKEAITVRRSAGGGVEAVPISWFEIYASQNELMREKEANATPLTIGDLKAHYFCVMGLQERLRGFYHDVLLKHVGGSSTSTLQQN